MLFLQNLNIDPSRVPSSPSSPSFSVSSNEENQCVSGTGVKRKREKLDHLTEEEKLMRRKLKNRISAQTARDRKKEKFNTLEDKVATLIKEKKQLMETNLRLKNNNEQLEKENRELKNRLSQINVNNLPQSIECNQSGDAFESAAFINGSLLKNQVSTRLILPLWIRLLIQLLVIMEKNAKISSNGYIDALKNCSKATLMSQMKMTPELKVRSIDSFN